MTTIKQLNKIINEKKIMVDYKRYYNSISKPRNMWSERDRKNVINFGLFHYRDLLFAFKIDMIALIRENTKLKRQLRLINVNPQ